MKSPQVAGRNFSSFSCRCLSFNHACSAVVSIDMKGMIEYWDPDSHELPANGAISFRFKSETDLYDLAKSKSAPCCLVMAPDGGKFAVTTGS